MAVESFVVEVVTDEQEGLPPILRGAQERLACRHHVTAAQHVLGE
ncbi:MAG TPA: hypothetical protein VET27_04350 [Mycobacterium sp.]|nr:hypothetical protein [Mycobacterium sp.]